MALLCSIISVTYWESFMKGELAEHTQADMNNIPLTISVKKVNFSCSQSRKKKSFSRLAKSTAVNSI